MDTVTMSMSADQVEEVNKIALVDGPRHGEILEFPRYMCPSRRYHIPVAMPYAAAGAGWATYGREDTSKPVMRFYGLKEKV